MEKQDALKITSDEQTKTDERLELTMRVANAVISEAQPEPSAEKSAADCEPSATPQNSSAKPRKRTRKDKSHRHATRHAVLARYPLETLERLGENIRSLKRIERELREELQPSGIVGAILFDRVWSSFLRCLLAARFESNIFMNRSAGETRSVPALTAADTPVLEWDDCDLTRVHSSDDLLRKLVLVQRYDRHFGRELFRCLSALLVRKNGGDPNGGLAIGPTLEIIEEPEE